MTKMKTKTEMNKLNLNNNVYNKMTKAHKILTKLKLK